MSDKKRLIWIDSLKGWLMILVILGHAIQSSLGDACFHHHVWNIIYSFHMPAFMAISGWFAFSVTSKSINVGALCKRRFNQLMVPYLSWSLLRYVVSTDYSIENLSRIIIAPDSYFWFLWVLFWIKIIFILNQKIAEKYHMDEIIPIGITCMVLLGIMAGLNLRVFGFQFLAYYYLFYFLGYAMRRFNKLQLTGKPSMICLGLLWTILAWFWNMHELPVWMPRIPHCPTSLLQYTYRGVTATLAIVVIVGVARKVLNSSNRFNRFIQEIGILSLGIYTCHLTLMDYIIKSLRFINPSDSKEILIILGFTICGFLSWVIVNLLKKNKIAAHFFLGK